MVNPLKVVLNVIFGHIASNDGRGYNPLLFLSSLGNGGMAVSFYVYLVFAITRQKLEKEGAYPITVYEDIKEYMHRDETFLVVGAIVLFFYFAFRHFLLLVTNIREYIAFRARTEEYGRYKNGNHALTEMAIPLTLSMTVNVIFSGGAMLWPNLTTDGEDSLIENLFPITMTIFFILGGYALFLLMDFFTIRLVRAHFDCGENNSLGAMVAVFALSMVAVGSAAPAAMSKVQDTGVAAIGLSLFFATIAILFFLIQLILGFRSMLEHGLDQRQAASLWIVIPIMTLLGITYVRNIHGAHHWFTMPTDYGSRFMNMTMILSVQIAFGLIGLFAMRRHNYFSEFIAGKGLIAGSYALVCPGVAMVVFYMFWLHKGLVETLIVEKYSDKYWLLMTPAFIIHILTVVLIFRLDSKFLWNLMGNHRTDVIIAQKGEEESEAQDDAEKGENEMEVKDFETPHKCKSGEIKITMDEEMDEIAKDAPTDVNV
eukprot:TRINITY_DN4901_c0_g1_i1.p2 TRINITY_DN4901_c0_g1~~TRINITY_DN4901_c0_g1_i1.p2  ORF type:complete len:484 (-),score=124.31 TRINITY_DN4901_c0_g1_i1:1978-3429(-)